MAHPYPPHDDRLPYSGRHHYFLTYCTDGGSRHFEDALKVRLVLAQFLRAANESQFVITAYCFMPDHVHLIVSGLTDGCDVKGYIRLAKQYSGFYFKQEHQQTLWQRYGFDRVIREH